MFNKTIRENIIYDIDLLGNKKYGFIPEECIRMAIKIIGDRFGGKYPWGAAVAFGVSINEYCRDKKLAYNTTNDVEYVINSFNSEIYHFFSRYSNVPISDLLLYFIQDILIEDTSKRNSISMLLEHYMDNCISFSEKYMDQYINSEVINIDSYLQEFKENTRKLFKVILDELVSNRIYEENCDYDFVNHYARISIARVIENQYKDGSFLFMYTMEENGFSYLDSQQTESFVEQVITISKQLWNIYKELDNRFSQDNIHIEDKYESYNHNTSYNYTTREFTENDAMDGYDEDNYFYNRF